jgi:tRNA pseudouridine32 synthase/23S rRNA pseudouridine746 synthase
VTYQTSPPSKFRAFATKVDNHLRPERFTFPYYYSPHPLAVIAMQELQDHLESLSNLKNKGWMFAVLVVENAQGSLGYLCSFSEDGTTPEASSLNSEFFVDPIFNQQSHIAQFGALEKQIELLAQEIEQQTNATDFIQLKHKMANGAAQFEQKIAQFQNDIALNKQQRKEQRKQAESEVGKSIDEEQLAQIIRDLGNKSSAEKRQLKALKQDWQRTREALDRELESKQHDIDLLQKRHSELANTLLLETRSACQFFNREGKLKSLLELFPETGKKQPIAFASEQNLPKLLQAAFKMGLTPLALGEFWWGDSPYQQIRQHKNLYPVCQSKCFEILEHMLEGIELDESPLEQTPSYDKELEIVYQDDALVVVNKPAEFLSVSGKYIQDSVEARIRAKYPDAAGPLIVHRLDMSTSGLLVLTLTPEANKGVQQQFIERSVVKRYTALLEGSIEQEQGVISLPLAGDMEDRPRQMVCHDKGRNAETSYQVIEAKHTRTKVHLYPKTGRTHQLRVHCAHQAGLDTPIVGDDLYGFKDDRLHLHAGYLKLRHPITDEIIEFEVPADF